MVVMKFGGTSVGSAESIKQVVNIITKKEGKKIVVLSAFSKVTNLLVAINNDYQSGSDSLTESIQNLLSRCLDVVHPLFETTQYLDIALEFINSKIEDMVSLTHQPVNRQNLNIILAQGEIISTNIVQLYLEEQQLESQLISALDFMVLDENNEPDLSKISTALNNKLENLTNNTIITQGFICRNATGLIANLERGGSDYTASLIGAVTSSEVIEIWTDIDGMHNNDPRFVVNTFSVEEVSFDEAAELAYFGAKILHPQSLIPAKNANIPVLLKNTFHPEAKGTIIKNAAVNNGVTSIAAKDGITAIKIKSYRMLLAYGFLKKVFEVFETYKTPIDMITTSEVAVSLTIDNPKYLQQIISELEPFGAIELDTDLSIVCVAGDFSQNKEGISAQVFHALKHIPIRMISYGGSNYNTSLLVKTTDKIEALNALNTHLFQEKLAEC